MKQVLIVGGGGREHALGWKIAQSAKVKKIYFAPGNGGTALLGENLDIEAEDIEDIKELAKFARDKAIDLTLVGPEAPLSAGIVDFFEENNLPIFGPSRSAAQIEASKTFAKRLMKKFNIPTANFKVFSDYQKAKKYLESCQFPQVLKADGLAAGKGVAVCRNRDEGLSFLKALMIEKKFGSAGEKVIIEECLFGQEVSIIAFSDGKTILPLLAAQDYKRIFDHDQGPNTGGMGAYVPVPFVNKKLLSKIVERILKPAILGMKEIGRPYKGILYAGLMLTDDGPKVLEFNCRFGDPETQPQLMLLKTDLLPLMLACLEGDLENYTLDFDSGFSVCVILASAGYPGEYQKGFEIVGLPNEANEELQVFHAGTRQENGKIFTNGGRVLGIAGKAADLKTAIKKVYLWAKKIDFAGKHYRRDIGIKALKK